MSKDYKQLQDKYDKLAARVVRDYPVPEKGVGQDEHLDICMKIEDQIIYPLLEKTAEREVAAHHQRQQASAEAARRRPDQRAESWEYAHRRYKELRVEYKHKGRCCDTIEAELVENKLKPLSYRTLYNKL